MTDTTSAAAPPAWAVAMKGGPNPGTEPHTAPKLPAWAREEAALPCPTEAARFADAVERSAGALLDLMLDAAEEQRGYAVLTFTNEGIGEALSGIADSLRCPPRPGSKLDKVVDWLDEIVSAGHRRRFDFEVRIDAREGIEAVAAMRQAARALHAPPPWQRHQRP